MSFDFDYYPPRKIETEEPPAPVESLPPLGRVCRGVWFSRTDPEPWLDTGKYLNIEDFWLAANPPKPSQLQSTPDGIKVLNSRIYLSHATSVFRVLCSTMVQADKNPGAAMNRLRYGTRVGDQVAERNVLLETRIAQVALEDAEVGRDVPGIKKAGKLLLRRLFTDDVYTESAETELLNWTEDDNQAILETGILNRGQFIKFIICKFHYDPNIASGLVTKMLNALAGPSFKLGSERFIRRHDQERWERIHASEVLIQQVFDYVDSVNLARMKDPAYEIPGMGPSPFAKIMALADELRLAAQQLDNE